MQDHWDVKHNLYWAFTEARESAGVDGLGIGGVDISLSDTDAVAPDHFFFRGADRRAYMIEDAYFAGVPQLVAEVLSCSSRGIDRGARREVYRRVGVPNLWLLEPATRTLEEYVLSPAREYDQVGRYGLGEQFSPALFSEVVLHIDRIFQTQSSRYAAAAPADSGEKALPKPREWVLPRKLRLGLEHILLLGHRERRREIWNNRAPCVLAFGSEAEASKRLRDFADDAAAWEQTAPVPAQLIETGLECAEIGRFRLTRRGRHVHCDVAVDARKFRELLRITAHRDSWDWGGE